MILDPLAEAVGLLAIHMTGEVVTEMVLKQTERIAVLERLEEVILIIWRLASKSPELFRNNFSWRVATPWAELIKML